MKKTLVCSFVLLVATLAYAQEARQPRSLRSLRPNGLRRALASAPAAVPNAAPVADSATAETSETDAADPKEAPALNWDATPVDIVFQTYGEQVGKTILKDPSVPNATITLKSREGQKLTKEEYLEAIEVVLEMNGIHLEPYGEKFIRAVPRGKARKEGIPLYMDIADVPAEAKDGRVISVMLSFKNVATSEVKSTLEQFKSDSAGFHEIERSNAILITDTWQNIKRMNEIAMSIDIASPAVERLFVKQIAYASANDIKQALEYIVQESQKDLEKNGKARTNTSSQPNTPRNLPSAGRGGFLRSGQPEQPKPLESTVSAMSDADRGVIRGKVVILADERSNKLVIITSRANYAFFEDVINKLDVETTPDTVVKVYRLKYAEADEVADMINDLIGNAPSSKSSTKGNQNAASKAMARSLQPTGAGGGSAPNATRKSANQRTGEAKAGELSKENTTVLADKRINGLVVMTNKELVPVVESIIEAMDVKLSQVLIETVIVEVTLGDDLQTGVDWVMRGRGRKQVQRKNSLGQPLYYTQRKTTRTDEDGNTSVSTSILSSLVPEGYSKSSTTTSAVTGADGDETGTITTVIEDTASTFFPTVSSLFRDGFVNNGNSGLGGGGGTASEILGTIMNVGTNAATAYFGEANPIGSGVNYLFKSDKLNLAAVIQASKTDSRAKYIASPIVMTVDNKEATIDATENRQFLTGWTAQSGSYGNSGQPTPNYSAKDIGIKIKTTPKINPNGTVMLEIEEEYSQFVKDGQTMLIPTGGTYSKGNVDLAIERKMSADILLENMQTVVLGGLTETYKAESETGIPILKDIPWIGKWLFGTVSQTETRKELLVFMTPYVLEEGDAAQAEALRRKRALSDTRPWDDHGWSASPLADPVSKKEQMRRLKDEWKKQDEERKTKLAIEDEKVKRAKALEQMSKEERKHWLEMHKDELDEADRDEELKALKEKMKSKDDETQDELRKLADEVRARKLKEAEAEIKAADEAAQSENEYQKLQEAKKGEEPVEEQPQEPAGDEVKE